jgi:predicted amino acid dehydrogenase
VRNSFLKKVEISDRRNEEDGHDSPEILENLLIVIDEKYPKEIDTRRPDDRSYHIIEPEIAFPASHSLPREMEQMLA